MVFIIIMIRKVWMRARNQELRLPVYNSIPYMFFIIIMIRKVWMRARIQEPEVTCLQFYSVWCFYYYYYDQKGLNACT